MKNFIILSSIFSFFFIFSCKDFVSKDDLNPNEPSIATLNSLLPVVEVALYATYTGSSARNTSMFMQHTVGVSNQSFDYNTYKITETDISNDWQTIYNSGFLNCNEIIQLAGTKNPYYAGIGKISKAMLIGLATDFWGDVPNSEAGKGQSNLTPKYDSQQAILQNIQVLLSEGIEALSKSAASNALLPAGDDYIFGGDVNSWIKTAYILKARYANRLSQRDPSGSATLALEFVDAAKAISGGKDMYAIFSSKGNELNQWFSFEDQRAGYMRMSATLVDTMQGLNDPRLSLYAAEDGDGNLTGTPNGGDDDATSYLGSTFAADNAPLPLVTSFEALFIEAEAALRAGNEVRAKTAFKAAVTANMEKLNVSSDDINTYLSGSANIDNLPEGVGMKELIMFQKWIAMFTQPEVWSDWRRTGIPALNPNPVGVIDQIPLRYPSEQRERTINPNATIISNLTTPVWWDAD